MPARSDLARRVARRIRRSVPTRVDRGNRLDPVKTGLIDRVFGVYDVRSFADLGGVWAVDAGYTFHALDNHPIERAFLVDTGITDAVRSRAADHPRLRLLEEDFGRSDVPSRIDPVDAVFLFDVLLHQVAPDWDEILAMYAGVCRLFLIVNPQYRAGPETIRLVDLPAEEYRATVPAVPIHDEALGRLDELHPKYARPYRDIHEIWQWGVVDDDLDRALVDLGFRQIEWTNTGPWKGLSSFDNVAAAYVRADR